MRDAEGVIEYEHGAQIDPYGFANCKTLYCTSMAGFTIRKMANPLVADTFHSSLGSANVLAQLVTDGVVPGAISVSSCPRTNPSSIRLEQQFEMVARPGFEPVTHTAGLSGRASIVAKGFSRLGAFCWNATIMSSYVLSLANKAMEDYHAQTVV